MTRECGSCTKCCGWLEADIIFDDDTPPAKIWPGRKCQYVTAKGCSVYEKRPENPCRSFKCLWLGPDHFPLPIDNIPMWMKPDESNVIMVWRENPNPELSFMQLIEAGAPISAEILSWAIQYALNNGLNIFYQLNSDWNKIGNQTFLQTDIQIV